MTETSAAGTISSEEFESAPCGLLSVDKDDVITRVNSTFLFWTGFSATDVVGSTFHSLLDAGSQVFYETRFRHELWSRQGIRGVALRLRRVDGTTVSILVNAQMAADPGVARLAVFDASSREDFEREMLKAKQAAETSEASVRALQMAATRFLTARTELELAEDVAAVSREVFSAVDTAVVLYGPDGASFTVLAGTHLSPVLHSLRSTRPAPARGLQPDEMLIVRELDEAFARSEETGRLFRSVRASAFSAVSISDDDAVIGAIACFYGRPQDFDEPTLDVHRALARQAGLAFSRVRLQERLTRMATQDQLTGLANRAVIDHAVASTLERSQSSGEPMAVLFIDLDGFKAINDELGHRAGDSVLTEVARRLTESIRGSDIVGRFGGDEFVIVCPATDAESARAVAERVRDQVRRPIAGLPSDAGVEASIGIATIGGDDARAEHAELLTRRADAAMYASKRQGPGRITLARV